MSRKNSVVRRDQRRADAVARNTAWGDLTPHQQITQLNLRQVTATKQRARIAKIIGA